jgi:hypothetical protein
MLPPVHNLNYITFPSKSSSLKKQPKFGRIEIRDDSQHSATWDEWRTLKKHQLLPKKLTKDLSLPDYYEANKQKAATAAEMVYDQTVQDESEPDKKGLLPKLYADIDHEAPRGKSRWPNGVTNTGDVLSAIGLDLYRLFPLKPILDGGYNLINKAVGTKLTPAQMREQHKQQALKLVQGIADKNVLKDITLEDGKSISEDDAKARLYLALVQQPEFMELANYAMSNAVVATGRWLRMAPPHLGTLVDKLVNLDFEDQTPQPIDTDDTPDRPAHVHRATAREVELDSLPLPGGMHPIQERARRLTLDIGHSEASGVAHEIEVSGSMFARTGRGIAAGLRYFKPFQQRELTQKEFRQYLEQNGLPPTKNPYKLAILNPGESVLSSHQTGWLNWARNVVAPAKSKPPHSQNIGMQIHTSDANTKLLLAAITRGHEEQMPPIAPNTVLAVRVRKTEKFKEKVLQPLVNTFRITEKVRLKDGKMAEIKEACLWPFIEAVLTEGRDGLGPNGQECFDRLADANVFKFECSDKSLQNFLNGRLKDKQDPVMRELKAKLAAIQVASLQYAEQVDFKETIASFAKGAIVGITGESIIEHTLHPKKGELIFKQPNYWANVALMSLVDGYDNWQGEQGSLESDLKGMGLKNTPKDVYGIDQKPSWKQKLKLLKDGDSNGPAGMSVAIAQRSAGLGALGGFLISMGTGIPFSKKDTSPWALGGASFATAMGTALSIPLNYNFTKPRVMMSYNEALKRGLLKLPADVNPDSKTEVEAHIDKMATLDMMARIGLQASAKAYTVVGPAMASLWALSAAGVPREVLQSIVFGLTPGAENAARGILTANRLYRTFPESVNHTERMTLDHMLEKPEREQKAPVTQQVENKRYRDNIRGEFNDRWSLASAWLMNKAGYWPLQATMTNRRKIDFVNNPKEQTWGEWFRSFGPRSNRNIDRSISSPEEAV